MSRVEYDLDNSNYISKVHDYVYYFSSEFNLNRFNEGLYDFIKTETNKLKAKYHVGIDISDYLSLVFYKRIEKRGFKVLTYDEYKNVIELASDFIYNS